jgi:hypothetical protein
LLEYLKIFSYDLLYFEVTIPNVVTWIDLV